MSGSPDYQLWQMDNIEDSKNGHHISACIFKHIFQRVIQSQVRYVKGMPPHAGAR